MERLHGPLAFCGELLWCISSGSRSLRCEWRQQFISFALEGLTTGHGSISGNILHVVAETHWSTARSTARQRSEWNAAQLAQGSTGMPLARAPLLMHPVIAL